MLVIADTSPLNYLILIDAVELLPRLYHQVILPQAAWEELKHPGAPAAVLAWANVLPPWVEIRKAPLPFTQTSVSPLWAKASAKRSSWLSCIEVKQKFCCCWTKNSRREVAARRLTATGTLGVLKSAAAQGWIDLVQSVVRLRQTNFRVSDQLLRRLLDEDALQKKQLRADPELP